MEGLSSDEKVKCIPQTKLGGQTPIHVNWIELLDGSVFRILHSARMYSPQYSLLASVFMTASCRGGVSKTPGDHHTQLQHTQFRKHFRNNFRKHFRNHFRKIFTNHIRNHFGNIARSSHCSPHILGNM